MFYLPRLYVYHCELRRGSAESERFKVMERRLAKQIMTPALIATWVFGILLVLTPGVIDWHDGWWHVKLLSVVLMSGFHGAVSKWRKDFRDDRNTRSHKFYRFRQRGADRAAAGHRRHGHRQAVLVPPLTERPWFPTLLAHACRDGAASCPPP